MFRTIRFRLTLWYVLVSGSLLIIFSFYLYSLIAADLRAQFDSSLVRAAKATAAFFEETAEQNRDIASSARETARELHLPAASMAILREHVVLASNSPALFKRVLSGNNLAISPGDREPTILSVETGNARLVSIPLRLGDRNYSVILLEDLAGLSDQLQSLRRVFYFGLPTALALAALGGFFLVKKSLAPVVAISNQGERISAKNLSERLTVPDKDELGKLTGVLNALLSRLDASFKIMRDFMADASHELQTPLGVIRSAAEVTLSRNRPESEYKEALKTIEEQSIRATNLVNDMLALARADTGERPLHFEELYLDDLVEECCRAHQPLAHQKAIRLTSELVQDVQINGDNALLKSLVSNLLDNALAYTPKDGSVSVRLLAESSVARLIVSDTGVGIPPECVERVFDRFYRVDPSRSRNNGGSGLGLAIVKLVAESHRGSVELFSKPQDGSTFTVSLPLRA